MKDSDWFKDWNRTTSHVVSASGGLGSFGAGLRLKQESGIDQHTYFLFADTYIEDDDLYRFLIQGTAHLCGIETSLLSACASIPPLELGREPERKVYLIDLAIAAMKENPYLKWIADGRTPWEVYDDVAFLGNSRIDPCSKLLKRELILSWMKRNFDMDDVTLYIGIDWTEEHRIGRAQERYECRVDAPLCRFPLMSQFHIKQYLESVNIPIPSLYQYGFGHNNCGGLCCKAGQGQHLLLLKHIPGRFAYHEAKEEEWRAEHGDYSMMKKVTKGVAHTLTLRMLREMHEEGQEIDEYDMGGCGCAIE